MNGIKHWWGATKTWQHLLLGLGVILVVFIAGSLLVRLLFNGKMLPGVKARGISVGGMTTADAKNLLDQKSTRYNAASITMQAGEKTFTIPATELGASFNNQQMADEAYQVGRDQDIITDLANQALLVLGLYNQPEVVQVDFNKDKLSDFFVNHSADLATPAQNASYQINEGQLSVVPNNTGQHLDIGQGILALGNSVSGLQTNITLPMASITPVQTTDSLQRQKNQVAQVVKQPIALGYAGKSWTISQQQLLDWMTADANNIPAKTDLLRQYYHVPGQLNDFKLERAQLVQYLGGVAKDINQDPINAQLDISGGKAVVFKTSRDGKALDVQKSADVILAAISAGSTTPVDLAVNITKAEISDSNIDNLGIKELISEGVTYFPGSPPNRLQNVRVGMSKYNGILLKPDQVFSFGEILGDVGPAQGYTPGLIILGDHEEKAYGGGLCQVSSTAYRAALLAGLPILQRTNHAFAISYYTAPYGVPGVDATIYYPQVDMKFKNDTGHYILIQTEMVGTTLKFRYYGTKTKAGTIRGPFYVSGSADATKPSETVFYRDVTDLAGNVTKTDTINTYYKSSLDFPITD